MAGIIDSHTHLDSFARKGLLDDIFARAEEAGVSSCVTIGTEPEDWALYRKLSADHPERIFYSVGLHPCSVEANWEEAVSKLGDFLNGTPAPVALGEMGLDRFHLPKDPVAAVELFRQQEAAFRAQLKLARDCGLPVVVHSRGAFQECVALIDDSGVDWSRVVFHCFAEGPVEMQQLMDRGGRGSFTGIVTYKNAETVREAARLQGLDRLMIETDAPYLTPVPHRGKPNELSYLRHTATFLSDLFGVDYEEFARQTSETTRVFFGLGR